MTTPLTVTGSIADAVAAIARAAEVPPEVKIAREVRARARQIGRLAAKLAVQLGKIDGAIDTRRERLAWARVQGWRAELAALGVVG